MITKIILHLVVYTLTSVQNVYHDLNKVTGLWYTQVPNFDDGIDVFKLDFNYELDLDFDVDHDLDIDLNLVHDYDLQPNVDLD